MCGKGSRAERGSVLLSPMRAISTNSPKRGKKIFEKAVKNSSGKGGRMESRKKSMEKKANDEEGNSQGRS